MKFIWNPHANHNMSSSIARLKLLWQIPVCMIQECLNCLTARSLPDRITATSALLLVSVFIY